MQLLPHMEDMQRYENPMENCLPKSQKGIQDHSLKRGGKEFGFYFVYSDVIVRLWEVGHVYLSLEKNHFGFFVEIRL